MILTISGPPGSGKTTVSLRVAKKLHLTYVSGGEVFRALAKEHNMGLEQFSIYAEKDTAIDLKIDQMLKEQMQTRDNIVVDSRLSGWIAYINHILATKIFIDASFNTRLERIQTREKLNRTEQLINALRLRENSEKKRYKALYDIDFEDLSIYDLVVDSDTKTVNEVVDVILDYISAHDA